MPKTRYDQASDDTARRITREQAQMHPIHDTHDRLMLDFRIRTRLHASFEANSTAGRAKEMLLENKVPNIGYAASRAFTRK